MLVKYKYHMKEGGARVNSNNNIISIISGPLKDECVKIYGKHNFPVFWLYIASVESLKSNKTTATCSHLVPLVVVGDYLVDFIC